MAAKLTKHQLELQEKKIELQERKANLRQMASEISINYLKLNLDIATELRLALTSSYLIKQEGDDIQASALFEAKEYNEIIQKYYTILMSF